MLLAVAACAATLSATATLAATTTGDMERIQYSIAVKKMEIMSRAVLLPPAESDAFWPVYRDYERERAQIEARTQGLVQDYMKSYETLDDAKAQELLDRLFELHEQRLVLLRKYAAQLQAKLPMRKVDGFVLTEFQLMWLQDVQRSVNLGLIR